jgi:subtilase family serine protease
VRGAYDVNPLLNAGYTGKGVTVAIVNTGIDGTFNSDIKMFDSKYGLPDAAISIVRPNGAAGTDQELPQAETTADAELIHAMAPDAKILLVLVGGQTGVLPSGFSYVIDNNAADIAMESPSSWYWGSAAANRAQSYSAEYAKSVAEKITLIAASNDFGSNNTYPDDFYTGNDFWTKYLPDAYMMPQYSPYVTAVGGTVLTVQAGSYSEAGWPQSGGGPSNLFPEPSWQTGPGVPQNGFRNIPDIALDASCDTPYAIDWNNDKWTTFCGTSGATPTFAGILADIQQAAGGRLGFLNPTLYSLAVTDPSVYHDITSGCSILQPNPNDNATETGYCAQPGWDFVTGWGSVDAARLASHLAPSANVPEFPVGVPILFWLILVPVFIATRRRSKTKLT